MSSGKKAETSQLGASTISLIREINRNAAQRVGFMAGQVVMFDHVANHMAHGILRRFVQIRAMARCHVVAFLIGFLHG